MEQFINFITNPTYLMIIGAVAAAYVLGLSLILAIWTARDARKRSKNFILRYGSPLFVLLFGLIGFLAYVVLRPSKTMRERHNERIERELLMQSAQEYYCPGCEKDVAEDFAFCPHCKVNFKAVCECGSILEEGWQRCAYCGTSIDKNEHKKKFRQPVAKEI